MARLVQGNPAERLNRYLTEHLQEDLSSEKICEAMGMGRTALYRLAKQTYGCGVKEYLRTLRIRRAACDNRAHKQRNLPANRHCGLQLFLPRIPRADRADPADVPPPAFRAVVTPEIPESIGIIPHRTPDV